MLQPVCANIRNRGFTLMPVVLSILAIIVVIGSTVLIIGYNLLRNSSLLVKSYQANGLVNACVEEALLKLQQDGFFTGDGSVTLSTGSCSYNVSAGAGNIKNVVASSSVSLAVRKANVTVSSTSPQIAISKWQEVGD